MDEEKIWLDVWKGFKHWLDGDSMYGVVGCMRLDVHIVWCGCMGVKSVKRTCWAAQECPAMTGGPSGKVELMGRRAKPLESGSTVG